MSEVASQFDLKEKVVAVIGGGGVLGSVLAKGLGASGAKIAVADLRVDNAQKVVDHLLAAGVESSAFEVNVLEKDSLQECSNEIIKQFGRVDVLLSMAGGNLPTATTSEENTFFDMSSDAVQKVVDLNLMGGAILPAQIFAKHMVKNENGANIIMISSMNAFRPLTRIAGYSAAKAAVSNFTQWLAVHLAQEYNNKVRVNALAPGFFLTDQNRFLLTNEDKSLTARGQTIIDHTPMGRFGESQDLVGTTLWLASDASRFVTGIVVPIDGGFSAFSGV